MTAIFPGDSELAARMRDFDWSQTALGSPACWPHNLRTALSICLTSRFPMHVWWGPELTLLYNDAYVPFLGKSKHPAALGRSGRHAWREIWHVIGPMIQEVWSTGRASWSEDIAMFFDRELPKEEVYATFSFSPIFGESGQVDGLFCACTESTGKLIGNRRLETVRQLGLRAQHDEDAAAACRRAAAVLTQNARDVPFVALYLTDGSTNLMELAASGGVSDLECRLPAVVRLDGEEDTGPWPFVRVMRTCRPERLEDLPRLGVRLPGGPWPEPAPSAMLLPLHAAGHEAPAGLILMGVSPRRPLDAAYRAFFELVAGHVATAVADARALETERRRALSLAELDRAKTAFFSNVSHEFRTPLTLMQAPLRELLQSPELEPEQRASLELVARSSRRLLKLVNTLLEFSRIEAGRVDARYEPADLARFTVELASVFRSAVERAGLRLSLNCPPLPEPVYVDREMWEKIVLNLLSNAFKYTLEGEIAIDLRAVEDRVVLSVRDTGVGIVPAELPRVFERFRRVQGVRSRTHEGTGIGLALVSELVELHGGRIEVESEPGCGSTFRVELPLGHAHLPPGQVAPSPSPDARLAGAELFAEEAELWLLGTRASERPEPDDATAQASVLLVDDNADMRAYLTRLLSRYFRVEAVADGQVALARAREQSPDLVLSDVMMPGCDGLSLVQALRADPATRELPIVLLSARAAEAARIYGLECGADDYLTKPFSARELVARVRTHASLGKLRSERALRAEQELALECERRARLAAEQASGMKDEFLACVAHELGTPLAAMRLLLDGLASDDFNRRRTAVEGVKQSVADLSRFVGELMDAARAMSGGLDAVLEPCDPRQAALAALDAQREAAERRRIRLELACEPSPQIEADPHRLQQLLSNLLSNAIKFSAPGGTVSVCVAPSGTGVALTVRDRGRGFSPAFATSLFQPFRQEERDLSRSFGGVGLGLWLVRQLVELHGGEVHGESPGPGQGATFTVWLPAPGETSSGVQTVTRRILPEEPLERLRRYKI